MRSRLLPLLLTLLLVGLAGCAGGSDSDTAGGDAGASDGRGGRVLAEEYSLDAAGGSGGGGAKRGSFGVAAAAQGEAGTAAVADEDSEGFQEEATRPATASDLSIGPSVIKTATVVVSLERDEFTEGVNTATALAERYGGYVVGTSIDENGRHSAAITIRIPAEKFGVAMGSVRGLGSVEREEVSGEDVSQELIDLEARLRNLRAQEAVLLRLMEDARTVLDTIRVQEHLSGVQLDIERIRGRLSYLDNQVAFSTIFIEMSEKGAGSEPKTGVIGRAWQRALDGAMSVVGGVIVATGFAVPIALLVVLAGLVYRGLRPRFRKAEVPG